MNIMIISSLFFLFFLYFFIIHLIYLIQVTSGDGFIEKTKNFLSFYGNIGSIKNVKSHPQYEYRFLEEYNKWLSRLGTEGEVDMKANYKTKPPKLLGYIALFFTVIRMLVFPIRLNLRGLTED